METGEIIKFLRIKKKLTQDELGIILGVKKSAIQKYESGAVQNLKMETIQKLCDYFMVPPSVFVYPEKIINIEYAVEFFEDVYVLESWNTLKLATLNAAGRKKLIEYAEDILSIEKYMKKSR